jgi:signal transduction histidine kinase
MLGILALLLMNFSNDLISKTLVKNNITADKLMMDDYRKIDVAAVLENGGGMQVINTDYEIVRSEGISTFLKNNLTTQEFTDFLMSAKSKGVKYSYSIKYNESNKFWLVVTFPTSVRIDFAIVHNNKYESQDMQNVVGVIVSVVLFYFLLLALSTVVYSKITSLNIINPLKKINESTRALRDGDYKARVSLDMKNEFGDLEYTFNSMAQKIEDEISLRKQSEDNRKRLILDISHDLKNPLACIMGYAELCSRNNELSPEIYNSYMQTIYDNSQRINRLINDLFELSKLESSDYKIDKVNVDICEFIRQEMSKAINIFENAGFDYNFDIPENEIHAAIDVTQMQRVFQNLIDNTVKYNPKGTVVEVSVKQRQDMVDIKFKDNGRGISADKVKNIFHPFIRGDDSRNHETGGTGLGLAIVDKIIAVHGGSIRLESDIGCGCEFIIEIPKI